MAKRLVSDAEMRLWKKIAKTVEPHKTTKQKKPLIVEDFAKLLSKHSHLDAPRVRVAKHVSPDIKKRAQATDLQRKIMDEVEERIPEKPLENREKDRKIRRGKTYVDATIDLHGFTQIAARSALSAFLMHHRNDGAKCVLVITGKGKLGDGIIKKRLVEWLVQPDIRAHVSSYSIAHQRHGGSGAYYVFLRKLKHQY
ncbi:Smr/MutS family protein [Hirschia baltica]|uniref:Smr protein/MutS2 n=1 Tax=Hirschia baltica (strain ATCC 49814 / DSM 5838 / IFAM 1418) TaxID=582402 RepID=C6XIK0_HIRBI|nr:Smr/MutS family protein [Hirschia baltica]ACT60807.1 Smr protein/MutS2 [Hirschia baltica ATCC 49814]